MIGGSGSAGGSSGGCDGGCCESLGRLMDVLWHRATCLRTNERRSPRRIRLRIGVTRSWRRLAPRKENGGLLLRAYVVDIATIMLFRLIRHDLPKVSWRTDRLLAKRRGGKFDLVLLHYCNW